MSDFRFRTWVRCRLRPVLTGAGRIGRGHFLSAIAALFVLMGRAALIGNESNVRTSIQLALVWPICGAAASRMHDFGRSGWDMWPILLVLPVSIIGPVLVVGLGQLAGVQGLATYTWTELAQTTGWSFGALLIAGAVVGLGSIQSDADRNSYGPPPADWHKIWSTVPFFRV